MTVKNYSSLSLSSILVAYVACLGLAPRVNSSSLTTRADTVLANGTSMLYSSSPLQNGLKWQASGFLQQGGCSSTKQIIKDCYELRLTSDPSMQLDPGSTTPRQRIEFLTAHQADDTRWYYTWRSYYPGYIRGGTTFFHLMQIFSTGNSGPVFTLSVNQDMVYIKDVTANKNGAAAALSSITDRTLVHKMTVTYGRSGSIAYTISDAQTQVPILSFARNSTAVGTGGTYLKFGAYRATYGGMSPVKAWYGDFVQTQLNRGAVAP